MGPAIEWVSMTARPGWKKLQHRATGFFKRFTRRADEPSAEAKIHSALGEKVSAVEKRMIKTILHPFKSLGGRAADTIADRLVNKVIDKGLAEVDQAAARALQRTVAAVALGLWGATTAAAISLALSAAIGGQPREWLVYTLIVSVALGLWNLAAFLHYFRLFRQLEGNTQRRLLMLVASKVGVKGVIIIAVPVAVLLALGIARLLLPIP